MFRRPSLWCRGMEEVGDPTFASLLGFVSSLEASRGGSWCSSSDAFLPSATTAMTGVPTRDATGVVASSSVASGVSSASSSSTPMLAPLWTLSSFCAFPKVHQRALHRCCRHLVFGDASPAGGGGGDHCHRSGVVGDASALQELMLVVPEAWHERLEVMGKLAELILEGGVATCFYACRPSVAATLREGRTTAVVMDFGFSHTTAAAVMDGQTLRRTVESIPIGSAAAVSSFLQSFTPCIEEGRPSQMEQENRLGSVEGDDKKMGGDRTLRHEHDAYPRSCLPRRFPAWTSLREGIGAWMIGNHLLHHHGRVWPRRPTWTMPQGGGVVPELGSLEGVEGTTGAGTTMGVDLSSVFCEEVGSFRTPDGHTVRLTARQCADPLEMYFGGMQMSQLLDRMSITMRGERIGWQHWEDETWRRTREGEELERSPNSALPEAASSAAATSSFHAADMIVRVKQRLDPEWQASPVSHIFTGGVSGTPGFIPRLIEALQDRDAAYHRYAACGALQGAVRGGVAYGTFAGASLAASSSSFFPLWVNRAEWEEEGVSVLFRKFFY